MLKSSKTRLTILITYWILGFIATHVPLQETGEVLIPNLDKLAHFVLYSGLGFFVAFWLGLHRETAQVITTAIVICVVYAVFDEGLQAFVPSRNASILDWIADVLGAVFGSVVYGFIRSAARKTESAKNTHDAVQHKNRQ